MKRSQPALRLSRTPLVYTVLQVRIAPVFSLKKYLPDLQETFRKSGFPRYREGFLQTLSFEPEGLTPKIERTARFEFYDKGANTGILIATDAITVHTNKYTEFESFIQTVCASLRKIKEVTGVEIVERVGLRYVDWLRPDDSRSVTSLVRSGLRGLDESALGAKDALSQWQIICSSPVGRMVVRLYQQKGHYLPPDLVPINLSYTAQIDPSETVTILDLDHFAEQSFDFDEGAISELAWKLHDNLDRAFRAAVTEEALEYWGAEHE